MYEIYKYCRYDSKLFIISEQNNKKQEDDI